MTPQLFRPHAESGPFNALLQVEAFFDDVTLQMKSGDVALVWSLAGVDYEGVDHAERQAIVSQFQSSLKACDESFDLSQYLLKSRVPPFTVPPCRHPVAAAALQARVDDLNSRRDTLYAFDLFLVLLLHAEKPRAVTTRGRQAEIAFQDAELRARVKRLHRVGHALTDALADGIRPTPLQRPAIYAFLERLLNFDPLTRGLPVRDRDLDYFLPNSPVDEYDDHLVIGKQVVKVLTMKVAPSQQVGDETPGTYAHILQSLDKTPGEWILCLYARAMSPDTVKAQIWKREKYYGILGLFNQALGDDAKTHLDEVRLAVEHTGRTLWSCSLTLLLHDLDPQAVDEATAAAITQLARHNGHFVEETDHALGAWLGMVPGNHAYNVRASRLPLTDANVADLSFLFRLDQGEAQNAHLHTRYLADFETETETIYRYNLHLEDVGHTLIVGSTGGGKTTVGQHLLLHLQQQEYDARLIVLEPKHDYRPIVQALGGSYLELGLKDPRVRINPFASPSSDAQRQFMHRFIRVLLDADGGRALTDEDDRDIDEQVLAVYAQPPERRRLSKMLLPKPLQKRLGMWLEGGRFPLFDHAEDTVSFQQIQAFGLKGMKAYPEVLDPLLFYVLRRARDLVDGRLLVVVMEEVWQTSKHPLIGEYLLETMKMGRSDNVALILVTQSLKDFTEDGLLPHVLQNCHTKLIVADPSFAAYRAQYAQALHLSEMDVELIEQLKSKRQIYLKRPHVSKVLNLIGPRIIHPESGQEVLV